MGKSACSGGKWGACVGDVEVRTKAFTSGGLGTRAIAAASTTCPGDPCDPYCLDYTDTATGIAVGGSLELVDGGISLAASDGGTAFSTCTGLSISPSAPVLTVTSLSPVTPGSIVFTAALTPVGCLPGPISPIWAVNDARLDSVAITGSGATGTLTVVSPIAGPVQVSAYLGPFVTTTTAQINVDVLDVSSAPMGYAAAFPVTTGAADTVTVLYPYAQTVFPLGLPPPIVQWSGSPASNAVRVTLEYVNGASSFRWSKIQAENQALTIIPGASSVTIAAAPRIPDIPSAAWFLFERSAKGADAAILVQRHVGGTLRASVSTPIHFANGQLKGTVYYQSYGTQLARNFLGGAIDSTGGKAFPGGAFGAATLAIAPGATTPTVVAGGTGGSPPDASGTYCRVCHTAAADGSLLVTQKYGGGNLTTMRYTSLSTTPVATTMSPADGRFAWPALFPTGGATSGYLFGNAGPQASFTSGPAPGGLDASNSSLTSAFYSVATATLGNAVTATYRTGGASPTTISIPNAAWGLKAAVPVFSPTGTMVAFQHHAGKVCATGTATQCTAEERTDGDKRSLGVMNFDASTKELSNFRILSLEANAPCNTTFHPSQPCFDVWPSFLPNGGVVFEKEVFHNGNVGGGLSDFAGTRSGCDASGLCSNDGTKGELWWVNTTGAPLPRRLNQANGRSSASVSYLPVGADSTYCRVGGFACGAGSDCCSGTCNTGRCRAIKAFAGSSCAANSDCDSQLCVSSKCGCARNADCGGGATCNLTTKRCVTPNDVYYTPPAQSYVPGHNAIVEPVLNYEPTVSPTVTNDAGGIPEYQWVLFTSRRMFGNIATGNPWWSDPRRHDISNSVTTKKLWIAAVSANPTAGSDPSYPAFYLPGQEWISGNAKAYWVQETCKAGNASRPVSSECDTTQDCCAGAVCSLQTPVATPAKRHCVPITACVALGGSCSSGSDCCGGRICSGGTCQDPPPVPIYDNTGTYTRDFFADCPVGFEVKWRFFDYQAILPADTSIIFSGATAETLAALPTAVPVVSIGTALPPSTTGWTGFATTVDDALRASGARSRAYLRVSMTLTPSADKLSVPILSEWRVRYSCTPAE